MGRGCLQNISNCFTGSKDTKYTLVEGGAHYLNATNPKEINAALLEMVLKYK
jgi:hypothetical protein